jgi:hypothetical protein
MSYTVVFSFIKILHYFGFSPKVFLIAGERVNPLENCHVLSLSLFFNDAYSFLIFELTR